MNRVKCLLLAAGLGTRLRPITDSIAKCLVPIAGRPLLDYWMDRLRDAGVTEVLINTHTMAEQVRIYIERANRTGLVRITETYEPELLGSAGTIANNPGWADEADQVLIVYADNLSDVDLGALLRFHRSHDDPLTMLLFHATDPSACGIAELDPEARIVDFVEKPDRPRGDLANAGVYVVEAEAYRQIAARKALDLGFDILPTFVGRSRGWVWNGYHRDIGTLESFAQARADGPRLLAGRSQPAFGRSPAVFLDRDGTLIKQVHYLSDPSQVELLPGGADAVRRLREAGYACVVTTNQSALGPGIITEDDLAAIHEAMHRQLAAEGTAVDAIYYCPTVPTGSDRTIVEDFERKPGPGMIWRAAADLGLDLTRSWAVGDMISDVVAGINADCRGAILVESGLGDGNVDAETEARFIRQPDLAAAATWILGQGGRGLRGKDDPHALAASPGLPAKEGIST